MASEQAKLLVHHPRLEMLPVEIIFQILGMILRNRTKCPDLNGIKRENHLKLGYGRPWFSRPRSHADVSREFGAWEYDRFAAWPVALALASTCRRLYNVVTPEIYKLDVKYSRASALFISARKGSAAAVRWSLENGARVNQVDYTVYHHDGLDECDKDRRPGRSCYAWAVPLRSRITPLHWAAIFGHEDIVDILLAHGADPTCREARGGLALDHGPKLSKCCVSRAMTHRLDAYTAHYGPAYGSSSSSSSSSSSFPVDPGVNPLYYATLMSVQPWAAALKGRLYPSHMPVPQLDAAAVRRSRLGIAKKLIRAGSSLTTDGAMVPMERIIYQGQGAVLHVLHQAAAEGNADLLEFLLSSRSSSNADGGDGGLELDPNLPDYAGFAPLHYLFHPHPDLVDDGPEAPTDTDAHLRDAERALNVLVRHGADLDRAMPPPITTTTTAPPPQPTTTALSRCLARLPADNDLARARFVGGAAAAAAAEGGPGGMSHLVRKRVWNMELRHRVHFAGAVALLRRGAALMEGDLEGFSKLMRYEGFLRAFQEEGEGGLPAAVFARLSEERRGVVEGEVGRAFSRGRAPSTQVGEEGGKWQRVLLRVRWCGIGVVSWDVPISFVVCPG
ncbi:hypothetical protein PG997_002620 [Apiospora hydei]|uniref:Ankyrin n=1 Tax=Apiospora hydei TaxID=1337664 RepID=A0ABR1WWW7_9PEZI